MVQNWNNLISYIKGKIGIINQIELTDDEIMDWIKEHTLPEFSIFSSKKLWVLLTQSNLSDTKETLDNDTYIIPVPSDVEIIDVETVYFRKSGIAEDSFEEYPYNFADPRDTVMQNTFSTMMSYLDSVQYFTFLPPKTIVFGKELTSSGVILELKVYHYKLDTIKRDIYTNLFRKMALKDVMELIVAHRSKFQNISSPFGEIGLNIDYLNNKIEKLDQEIQEYKNWLPPETLCEWLE